MHYFNSRFRSLFELRNNRAQLKSTALNQRLKNTLALDYLEGAIRIGKFSMKVGD